ncbi:MAG: hypothetical protein PHV78_03895 [Patescibacteria group bacterium]|nr:hypothetical protein [Patescibacteria group bacterium]MDD5121472.1 hypothetical protein [Patescibacteria group bacterium]MDD5222311.1 hypothetical protein [Patescibacteria group bacterium]MDD5396366.1 hypothetical protein [Patescibacteria group bacterium]
MAELNSPQELEPKIAPSTEKATVEQPITPEIEAQKLEQAETLPVEKSGEIQPQAKTVRPSVKSKKVPTVVLAKSETLKEIENILSEDLEPVYKNLSAALQEQFRKKGEETATKIEQLISQTKFTVKKILELIYNWLKILPGVNRFFLEQESKIRTDKILALAEKKRK